MKIHLAVSEDRDNGARWTGSLCLNLSNKSEDGMNVTAKSSEVTCKKCLKIMAWPKHWAHRRFITKDFN